MSQTPTLDARVDAEVLLDALALPAFVVGPDHTVLGYNDGLATLLNIEEDRVGEDARESIAAAAYADDRREWSLADKVVEHPTTAAREFENVRRTDRDLRYSGEYVYEDKSTMQTARGEEVLISFVASPIFDGGELQAVLEIVEERDPSRGELTGLAGILAHDLRNPLEVVQTFTELAADDIDDDHYDRIRTNLDRMTAIIDDTLALYRQTQAETDTETHDVTYFATQAWETVDTGDRTLETTAATVECDPDQLRLLFENVFRNSVEHADAAGRTAPGHSAGHGAPADERPTDGAGTDSPVTVRVGPLADRSGFYVEDTGVGIPPDERQVVLEHGHSTDDDGTGLGLTIVQQIARDHDWELTVTESAEGGARFEFAETTR